MNISRWAVIWLIATSVSSVVADFKVYWNVPSFVCTRHGVHFDMSKYGIVQNYNDSFNGEQISILYAPGLFPHFENEDVKQPVNGGIPQLGDLALHIRTLRQHIQNVIPDPNFKGMAVLDFEYWRPIYMENWSSLRVYQTASKELVKQHHPFWSDSEIEKQARRDFEDAGKRFMEETLKEAMSMRPGGRWGYYGFPQCFTFTGRNNRELLCPQKFKLENDRMDWLWNESGLLLPSLYLFTKNMSEMDRFMFVFSRIEETRRLKYTTQSGAKQLSYIRFQYTDRPEPEYVSYLDLLISLGFSRLMNMDGAVIWGSSKDVASKQLCQNLQDYVETTLVPVLRLIEDLNSNSNNSQSRDAMEEYLIHLSKFTEPTATQL